VEQSEREIIEVSCSADESRARGAARAMAGAIGFDETVVEEIAIAVSELASNLSRHTKGGKLVLTRVVNGGRDGIRIESHDTGPGIPDVEEALTDGFSTVGGLGCGLGTLNRLMDEFDIKSQRGSESGTHIVCTRWLHPTGSSSVRCPLSFGAATRSHPITDRNGDAFIIKKEGQFALVGVIDGLGHGQFAQLAAQTARQYVESHCDQPFSAIFRGAGRACRSTRGVVMALARFDWEQDLFGEPVRTRLTLASVGNIETRVFGSSESMNFRVRRGIIGLNAPEPVVTEHHWEPNFVMVMHSDGLSSRWRWEDFSELEEAPATVVARRLLLGLAKDNDDATVVVVNGVRPNVR
jgi:anti-sigma regulatory factor (Ser/Thr protein kinase)